MEFTEEEKKKLIEFHLRMEPHLTQDYARTDLYLIRWLRARDLNLDAAEEMLKKHLRWRGENKIDILLQGLPDSYFSRNYPYWLNGIDLKGQPAMTLPGEWHYLKIFYTALVLCCPVGEWDIRKVVEEDKIKEFEDYVNRMYERILEAIRRCDERRSPDQPPITQFTLILNWDKFSVRQTANLKAIQTLVNIAATYESHYPEILSEAFFLNTNQFFQIVFAMMKPILAPRTLSKITCYGTERSVWEPVVRSIVDETQIPRQFGG